MPQPTIFISYSHQDETWKDRLQTQLRVLELEEKFEVWDDRQITTGDDWLPEIEAALNRADLAVLLISAKFLTSNFIRTQEVPAILQRRTSEGMRVFPIIIEPCPWNRVEWLKSIQVRPKDGNPLSGFNRHKRQQILSELATEIADLVKSDDEEQPAESNTAPPAPNPFGDQGIITDPARFFNRDELLRQIFEELSKGSNLSLVGESQVGKSSLLAMICARGPEKLGLRPEQFAYLNLEWVDNEDEFYEALCDALQIDTCRGWKMTRALQGKNIVLCVDEIEKMKWDGFTKNLRAHLRGLTDGSTAPLRLVFAGRSPLGEIFPDSPELDSPLAGICRQLNVGPFTAGTARAFLHHRLQATGISFSPAEIDDLFSQTRGHPARLQQAAAALYEKKRST